MLAPARGSSHPRLQIRLMVRRRDPSAWDPALSASSPFKIRVPSFDASRDPSLEGYGPSCRGVVLSLGAGATMLAMRRPATSETAVSTIVNAVSMPATVFRSINDDMLR